MHTPYGTGWLP